jgi:Glycine/D-amino acid oxidases (deaminating)
MNAVLNKGPAQRAPSYYSATLNDHTQYPTLKGTVHVDVAIIGGGFTGVATAVELAERGLKVAIVETNRIGWGASGLGRQWAQWRPGDRQLVGRRSHAHANARSPGQRGG